MSCLIFQLSMIIQKNFFSDLYEINKFDSETKKNFSQLMSSFDKRKKN